MSTLSTISDSLAVVERQLSRLMVVGFVGLITTNVAMRYLAGRPIVYAEELAAILLVWLAFVAISISVHDRAQIGVTLLTDRLSSGTRRGVDRMVNVVIAAMLVVLLWKSMAWVQSASVAFEQVITTGWTKRPFFFIVPVFCMTTLVHIAAQIQAGQSSTTDSEPQEMVE